MMHLLMANQKNKKNEKRKKKARKRWHVQGFSLTLTFSFIHSFICLFTVQSPRGAELRSCDWEQPTPLAGPFAKWPQNGSNQRDVSSKFAKFWWWLSCLLGGVESFVGFRRRWACKGLTARASDSSKRVCSFRRTFRPCQHPIPQSSIRPFPYITTQMHMQKKEGKLARIIYKFWWKYFSLHVNSKCETRNHGGAACQPI